MVAYAHYLRNIYEKHLVTYLTTKIKKYLNINAKLCYNKKDFSQKATQKSLNFYNFCTFSVVSLRNSHLLKK